MILAANGGFHKIIEVLLDGGAVIDARNNVSDDVCTENVRYRIDEFFSLTKAQKIMKSLRSLVGT